MRKILGHGLLWCVLLVTTPVFALTPEERLAAHLERLTSLEAYFEQELLDARGQRLQRSQGELRLLKPGRFYWATQHPFPEILISNGETLWLYDPELAQVTVQSLDQRMAHTPALILSGEQVDLSEDFSIDYRRGVNEDRFILKPLAQDSLFERLELTFRHEQIHSLVLEDGLGQRTQVSLTVTSVNQPLDPEDFEFVIPAGVDIIQE